MATLAVVFGCESHASLKAHGLVGLRRGDGRDNN
jgi:hypothetical protein